jgi:NAD(P)-dependent dehydrogenase (short-subunit alcohol dehydrogenase family)
VQPGPFAGLRGIVTGAAGGIGRATTAALAQAGAQVVAVDLALAAGTDPPAERVSSVVVDISDPDAVADLYARLDGPLHFLVNNAGVAPVEPFLESTAATWRRTFAVNVEGTLSMTVGAARRMVGQPPHPQLGCRAKIVNVSSAAAESGRPLLSAYGASKAALNHLTKSAAVVLGEHDVCVTAVYPGNVRDGMWRELGRGLADAEGRDEDAVVRERLAAMPTGRFQEAEETARAILFALGRPGLELNGRVVWSEAHVGQL